MFLDILILIRPLHSSHPQHRGALGLQSKTSLAFKSIRGVAAIPSSSTQTTYAKRLVLARLPKKGLPRLRKIHLWHVQFTTFKSMVNHGRLGKSKCLRQCDSMHSYEYKRKYLYIYIFFSNVFLGWIVSWRNTFGAWFAATCAAARMPSGLVLFPQIMFSKFWSCAMRVLV